MPGAPTIKEIIIAEHDDVSVKTKKVILYGWDSDNLEKVRLKVNSNGELIAADTGSTPVIYNVSLILSNTEYSQLLPNNTKKFRIYAVDSTKQYPHSDVLKLSFIENESDTTFISIPSGNHYQEEGINVSNLTLYFQSLTGSAYVIIIAWT